MPSRCISNLSGILTKDQVQWGSVKFVLDKCNSREYSILQHANILDFAAHEEESRRTLRVGTIVQVIIIPLPVHDNLNGQKENMSMNARSMQVYN